MNRKSIVLLILALLLGAGLGVGGIIGVQGFLSQTQTKKVGPMVDLGEFTVNLKGGAFLKTTITVEGTNAKAEVPLKEQEKFLKDRINTVLSNKSLEDVQTPAAREKLRGELIVKLNEVGDNKIKDVLFLSLVYQ